VAGPSLAHVSTRWRVAIAAPFAACLALCVAARPEPASLLAPLLGPWAGRVYGHAECTLAASWPAGSVALLALGLAGVGLAAFVRGALARRVLGGLLIAWSALWSLLAAGSLANTLG
jgi:hypothetical protein